MPGFEHDVFVSYAHADNKLPVGTSAKAGWVTALKENLNLNIGVIEKDIFIDHRLNPGDEFSEILVAGIERSALLLVLLSQHYIDSVWCGKELAHFIKVRGEDPNKPRNVVAVELAPFDDLQKKPDNILNLRSELIQAQFWVKHIDSFEHQVMGYPSPQESGLATQYFRAINQLTRAIDARLRSLAADVSSSPKRESHVTGPLKVFGMTVPVLGTDGEGMSEPEAAVILADVTDDLVDQRQMLRTFLEKEGVRVLPIGAYLARSKQDFEETFYQHLSQSILFVQLLSRAAGRVLTDLEKPLPQLQFARAQASGKPIMQWCAELPNLDAIQDLGHRALFATPYLQRSTLEQFKQEVLEKFRALEAQRTRSLAPEVVSANKKFVFVDDAYGEASLSRELRDLLKRERYEIRSLPANAKLVRNGFELDEFLKPCRAAVTLYTNRGDQLVVAYRLAYLINQVAEKSLALARWGIYFGPQVGAADVVREFGIDSEQVVGIPDEDALLGFLRSVWP